MFTSDQKSHKHSLEVLDLLYQYNDFMDSIDSVCDMGCSTGLDLEWWATRMVEDNDENYIPLEIDCTGIDTNDSINMADKYNNIEYIQDCKYLGDIFYLNSLFYLPIIKYKVV